MSKKLLSILSIIFISVASIACAIALYLYSTVGRLERQLELQNAQIASLTEQSAQATIVRRASEQLEEIAYQQKSISDIQRTEALHQKQEAEFQQNKALLESQRANLARADAVEAYGKMEEQKIIADQKRREAEISQAKTDSLARLALGRSLSSQAITIARSGDLPLAGLLCYAGYVFTEENQGNIYQSVVYNSLNEISLSSDVYSGHSDMVRDLVYQTLPSGEKSIVSVSQAGEIIQWNASAEGLVPQILYSNPSLDFRSLCLLPDSSIIAGSFNGTLAHYKNGKTSLINTGQTALISLHYFADNLIAAFKNGLFSISPGNDTKCILLSEAPITSAFNSKSVLYFASRNGKLHSLDKNLKKKDIDIPAHEGWITAICPLDNGGIACGYNNGSIVISQNGSSINLHGHLSDVTSLIRAEQKLISASLDGSLRLWDLSDPGSESLPVYQASSWLYCAALSPDNLEVCTAGADKNLQTRVIDAHRMANVVKSSLSREFTQTEWNKYVGEVAPYRTLMQ